MGLFASTIEIECEVDLERSDDSFHAYAVPDGVAVGPGDKVRVHGMPQRLQFGENRQFRARATLTRAGALARMWTEFAGLFAITGLYEVGFAPADELALHPREAA